jgi:hypothetical protein
LWDAIATSRWPETSSEELRAHVDSCGICREFTDIAGAVHADGIESRRGAAPPTSAIVWWRAQMRARQDAARAVDRPITIAHALAVAAGFGVTLALLSVVVPWLRPFVIRLLQSAESVTILQTLGLAQQWAPILAAALLMMAVLGPVALYLALADD